MVDLVWTEPRRGGIHHAGLDPYSDIEGDVEQLGRKLYLENAVYPDGVELAYAARRAGPVYLSFYYDHEDNALHRAPAPQVAELLRQDFGLTAEHLAERLQCPVSSVEAVLAGVKRTVAREFVAVRMKAEPVLSLRQVHESLLRTPFDHLTADRADVSSSFYSASAA